MEFLTMDEALKEHGLKVLVYGPAGVGKTRLSATVPDRTKTIILSAEAGLKSLREFKDFGAIAIITDFDKLVKVYNHLRKADKHDFDWVILDSLSEIAEVLLSQEKINAGKDPRAAYGQMADRMFKMVRLFRDLPMNVVMTAKQTKEKDDQGRLLYGPSFPGRQLTEGVPYLFDEVFAMRSSRTEDGVKRWLQTVNDGYYDAKDRSGALDEVERPSLKRIVAKIDGDIETPPIEADQPVETTTTEEEE